MWCVYGKVTPALRNIDNIVDREDGIYVKGLGIDAKNVNLSWFDGKAKEYDEF